MLDELTKSIKAQLYERASSPLLASFGIAWLGWNYRFVLVLITSGSYAEKFAYIDTNIFPNWQQILLNGSIYPLVTALFMLFVYPIPAKFVYRYWRERQRELKEIQKNIDDETPLTREEAKQIRQEAVKAALDYEAQIQNQSAEIARLKDLIQLSQNVGIEDLISKKPPDNNNQRDLTLEKSQLEILYTMAEDDEDDRESDFINSSPGDKVKTKYDLQRLIEMGLVQRRGDFISLTHKGRAFLVEGGHLKQPH